MDDEHTTGEADDARGRRATHPREIPKPGWRDVLIRAKNGAGKHNVSLVAAGVAFYGLLAIFPGLAALVSIYGLIADPATVEQQLTHLAEFIPREAQQILQTQMETVASQPDASLSFGVAGGLLFTIWSATKGVKAMMTGLNIVYDESEDRGFVKLSAVALGMTVGALVLVILALGAIVVLPLVIGFFGLPGLGEALVSLARWPLLFLVVALGIAVLYRYGPSRAPAQWRWVNWGSGAATLLWVIASIAFSFYVANFGSYNETYGSVGAVVILLMWFYLSAYIVLLAAEVNAEMERQTRHDTTRGKPMPMGRRGAYVADTVGDSP